MADPDAALSVSIINYRTAAMTIRCAGSVLADLGDVPARIVIVDNASGDGSGDEIARWIAALPEPGAVRLVRSPVNSGFSGGHNLGMEGAAPLHLVLNSDALLRPGFVPAILAAAAADSGAGLVAPRIEHEDGSQQVNCFRIPSPFSELIRGARTGPVTRLLRAWDVPLDMPPGPGEIGWASFACILLRRQMADAIGPMDEGYFLYFEDTEYCLRAGRAGWRIAHAPQARVVHLRGGSAPVKALATAGRRLPSYYYASRARLLAQAHGRAGLWAANLAWHAGRAVAGARRLMGRPPPPALEAEARDIWTGALRPLASAAR